MSVTIARWRPEYETGDILVDQQHQSLFSTINALNNAMLEGQGEALLEKTLQSLKDYTTVHFDTEEQFMQLHQYPGYADHKQKHEALKAAVLEFEQKNHHDLRQLTSAVSHFLTDWLIHHIKNEDQKMITFCCQRQQAKAKPAESLLAEVSATGGLIAPWRAEYETGYTLIDDQHRSLFHSINALHSAMLAGRAEELLERTLKSLRNYTTIHFETEEQFMLKYGYPGYMAHQENHTILRKQVAQFSQQEKSQNTSQIIITVSRFLTNWLIHHIKDEDQKMINFLRAERQKGQDTKAAANSFES